MFEPHGCDNSYVGAVVGAPEGLDVGWGIFRELGRGLVTVAEAYAALLMRVRYLRSLFYMQLRAR